MVTMGMELSQRADCHPLDAAARTTKGGRMKEYISKDRVKQFVCGHCNEVCSEKPCESSDCDWMAFIDKEPAADVVSKGLYEQIKWERDVALAQLEEYGVSLGEKADVMKVRHGRWVNTHSDSEFAQCSLCKYPVYAAWIWNLTSYCPNCGAKMDVEEV